MHPVADTPPTAASVTSSESSMRSNSMLWMSSATTGARWSHLRLAQLHPARVTAAVGISMTHLWPMQRHLLPALWRWWITALFEWPALGPRMAGSRRVLRWLLRRDAADASVWTDELLDSYTGPAAEPGHARAGHRLFLSLLAEMPGLILSRRRPYQVPTMIVGGYRDALVPPSVLTVPARLAGQVRLRILPGGHYLLDENPDAVLEAVREHLAIAANALADQSPSDGWAPRTGQTSTPGRSRRIRPSTPLTNRGDSSVDSDLASSTASSMATASGTSSRQSSS